MPIARYRDCYPPRLNGDEYLVPGDVQWRRQCEQNKNNRLNAAVD